MSAQQQINFAAMGGQPAPAQGLPAPGGSYQQDNLQAQGNYATAIQQQQQTMLSQLHSMVPQQNASTNDEQQPQQK